MQDSYRNPSPQLSDWALGISLAVTVLLPDGPKVGLILFGLWGFYLAAARPPAASGLLKFWSANRAMTVTGLMLIFFLAISLILLAHQKAGANEYQHLIPFLLFPFACLALASQPIRTDFFAIGAGLGGCSSGLLALAEVLHRADELPVDLLRAKGWMTQPVQFGNVCVFLSVACLVMLVAGWAAHTRLRRWVLFLGFNSALLGAVLSGSKGSFLAFMIFAAYFFSLVMAWQLVSKKLLLKVFASLILLFTVLIVISPLSERLKTFHGSMVTVASALSSNNFQFNLEGLTLDVSASNRLAQYEMAVDLIKLSPWTGMARQDIIEEQKRRMEASTPGFIEATRFVHSDYFDLLLNKGLLGFAALTGFFVSLLFALRQGGTPASSAPFDSPGLGHQPFLLGSSILLLLAAMGLFNVVVYRVPEMSPSLFILACCLALLYGRKLPVTKPPTKAT